MSVSCACVSLYLSGVWVVCVCVRVCRVWVGVSCVRVRRVCVCRVCVCVCRACVCEPSQFAEDGFTTHFSLKQGGTAPDC